MKRKYWMVMLFALMSYSGLFGRLIGTLDGGVSQLRNFASNNNELGRIDFRATRGEAARRFANFDSVANEEAAAEFGFSLEDIDGILSVRNEAREYFNRRVSDPSCYEFWDEPDLLRRIEEYCSSSGDAVNAVTDESSQFTIVHEWGLRARIGYRGLEEAGPEAVLDRLIEFGADLEARDQHDRTVLEFVLSNGLLQPALLLIDRGASIDVAWCHFLSLGCCLEEEEVELWNTIFDRLFERQIMIESSLCLDLERTPLNLLSAAISSYLLGDQFLEEAREEGKVSYVDRFEQSRERMESAIERILYAPFMDLNENVGKAEVPLAVAIWFDNLYWAEKILKAGASPLSRFTLYLKEEGATNMNALEYARRSETQNTAMIELLESYAVSESSEEV